MSDSEKGLTPTPAAPTTQPSGFTKAFKKPVEGGAGGAAVWKFSWRSWGCILLTIGIFLAIIAIILGAVLGTVLPKKKSNVDSDLYTGEWPFSESIKLNFADPALFHYNSTWYAYGTNNAARILNQPHTPRAPGYGKAHVQLASSPDFQNWTLHDYNDDPLLNLGTWVANGWTNPHNYSKAEQDSLALSKNYTALGVPKANVWAPEIIQRPSDSKLILYYAATSKNHTKSHCIGASIGSSPLGPFQPLNTTIACPTYRNGAIDPAPFIHPNGTVYLAYKIDSNDQENAVCGNSIQPLNPVPIMLQRLKADAVTPDGPVVQIMERNDSDGPLVEAPAIVRSDEGIYFLFFSSGCTYMANYDVKYATSDKIEGPYTRSGRPLLKTGDWGLQSPGSVSVKKFGEDWRIGFHGRVDTDDGGVRELFTGGIAFNGTKAELVKV